MSFDPTLPREPIQAAALLAEIENKSANECSYPTCHQPRQLATGTGRPLAYCSDTKHTAVNAHRARQLLLAAVASGEQSSTQSQLAKRTLSLSSPTIISPESLRGSVLNRILQLQTELERYVTVLGEMLDPEISAAQIQVVLDQANSRIADMQQALSSEQALRLKAEKDLLIAQEKALAERDAAEQAIQHMEEVETNAQKHVQQVEERLAQIQDERDATVDRARLEAEKRIKSIQAQMDTSLYDARKEVMQAVEDARISNAAALEARAQKATAERLFQEAQNSLERERAEIDRLREEIKEVRIRAEVDLQEERKRAQMDQDRLREELTATRKHVEQATTRADTLASANDQLRTLLFQLQQPNNQ